MPKQIVNAHIISRVKGNSKSDRTAAFKRERDHIASSIARLLNGLTTASQLTGEGVAPPRLEVVESGFVDDIIEEATPSLRPRTPQKLEPLVLTSGFETGRIKGSLWDEVEITKQMYRGRIDDVHESLMSTQSKLPKALGAAPPRPHPQRLVERQRRARRPEVEEGRQDQQQRPEVEARRHPQRQSPGDEAQPPRQGRRVLAALCARERGAQAVRRRRGGSVALLLLLLLIRSVLRHGWRERTLIRLSSGRLESAFETHLHARRECHDSKDSKI